MVFESYILFLTSPTIIKIEAQYMQTKSQILNTYIHTIFSFSKTDS